MNNKISVEKAFYKNQEVWYNFSTCFSGFTIEPIQFLRRKMKENFISYFSPELLDEVISKSDELIKSRPNDPKILCDLGKVQLKKGNYPEALLAFEQALKLNPNDVSTHLLLGQCHEHFKNFEKAELSYKNVISIQQKWPDAFYCLGKVLFETGRFDEAIERLNDALKINPNYKNALFQLALVYEKKQDLPAAIAAFKKLVSLCLPARNINSPFPYDTEILFDNPALLDELIRQLVTFLQEKDGFADLHFKLGMAYRRKGMKPEAMTEFRKALRINPNYHLARHFYWHWEDDPEAPK
ncbi:tetratricopeptide repeat protein [bacterium]|nr:tetratricopeptide repeat protein [bacterium]